MANKRPDPITQGSILDIYKYFFAPLVPFKPQAMDQKEFMEVLFDMKHRDILTFEAYRTFKMPGLFYAAALTKIQGLGKRQVSVGDVLHVRLDGRTPDAVDVEVVEDDKSQVFCLTALEWSYVQRYLHPAEEGNSVFRRNRTRKRAAPKKRLPKKNS